MPSDPHQVGAVLERAHKGLVKPSGGPNVVEKKHQLEVAGVGAKGSAASSPSSVKTLNPLYLEHLRAGGWSEEEIKKIEQKLE